MNKIHIDYNIFESLLKDAERYRWLRDVASADEWELIGHNTDPTTTDSVVDACRPYIITTGQN